MGAHVGMARLKQVSAFLTTQIHKDGNTIKAYEPSKSLIVTIGARVNRGPSAGWKTRVYLVQKAFSVLHAKSHDFGRKRAHGK